MCCINFPLILDGSLCEPYMAHNVHSASDCRYENDHSLLCHKHVFQH